MADVRECLDLQQEGNQGVQVLHQGGGERGLWGGLGVICGCGGRVVVVL